MFIVLSSFMILRMVFTFAEKRLLSFAGIFTHFGTWLNNSILFFNNDNSDTRIANPIAVYNGWFEWSCICIEVSTIGNIYRLVDL